jgi:hypothetical protein
MLRRGEREGVVSGSSTTREVVDRDETRRLRQALRMGPPEKLPAACTDRDPPSVRIFVNLWPVQRLRQFEAERPRVQSLVPETGWSWQFVSLI